MKTDWARIQKSIGKGEFEQLFTALENEICPPIWKKFESLILTRVPYEFKDFVQESIVKVLEVTNFVELGQMAHPELYLRKVVERNTQVIIGDGFNYYYIRLEKALEIASLYTRVGAKHYALRQFAENAPYSHSTSDLFSGMETKSEPQSYIRDDEIHTYLRQILLKAKAPVQQGTLFDGFKLKFGLRKPLMESLSPASEDDDKSKVNPEEIAGTDSNEVEDREVEGLVRSFWNSLSSADKHRFKCFADEYARPKKRASGKVANYNWESIRKCMGLKSGQSARNAIYQDKKSILKRCRLFLSRNGYKDFGNRELEILCNACNEELGRATPS